MAEREADVVVVGAGIMGCATAYHLARRGVRTVVLMEANRMWRGLAADAARMARFESWLIVDGKTSLDISAFRISRFAEGAIAPPRSVL